jgi:hypothetical protein
LQNKEIDVINLRYEITYKIIGMLMTSPWVHLGGLRVIPVRILGYIDETE